MCGEVNAFNMVDGIDWLLARLYFISFAKLGIFLYQNSNMVLAFWYFLLLLPSSLCIPEFRFTRKGL
ncbi:MAG: hypothetical protein ACTS73_03250 [Arsenophonus sp. NEOnobi-MAG3]